MKCVVYSASRNLYPYLKAAVHSLLKHTTVDKVYLLIEDDKLPFEMPDVCETVNISKQSYFRTSGPNFKTRFTYLSLMRVCYAKLFPDLDKILQLDVDTIVTDDISKLWDVDLNGKYFAAVEEYLSNWKPFGPKYYNIGVAMFNLDYIRKTHVDDDLINDLNNKFYPYIDQDVWNKYGVTKAADLDVIFNESFATGYTDHPAIVHYAGVKNWFDYGKMKRWEYLYETRKEIGEEW